MRDQNDKNAPGGARTPDLRITSAPSAVHAGTAYKYVALTDCATGAGWCEQCFFYYYYFTDLANWKQNWPDNSISFPNFLNLVQGIRERNKTWQEPFLWLVKMEWQILFRPPVKVRDHLQRRSLIFWSEETKTNLFIWHPTEISGIFGIMESMHPAFFSCLQRLSTEWHKTKVITLVNYKWQWQSSEPIKTPGNHVWPMKSAGKRVRVTYDWFHEVLLLIGWESGARFWTNSRSRRFRIFWSKETKTNLSIWLPTELSVLGEAFNWVSSNQSDCSSQS